jgi:hypothetical protein
VLYSGREQRHVTHDRPNIGDRARVKRNDSCAPQSKSQEGAAMPKVHLALSSEQLATAQYELLSYRRHDNPTCAVLCSADGEPYVVLQINQQLYGMRQDGTLWSTITDDVGMVALDDAPPRLGSGHRRIGPFERERTAP